VAATATLSDTWRRPTTADACYLMFLMTIGYTQSEVKQLILGAPARPTTRQWTARRKPTLTNEARGPRAHGRARPAGRPRR
jgi:hypothetical protein